MNRVCKLALGLLLAASVSFADDAVTVMHGTVTKVDKATKTVVVKTADGTSHAIKYTTNTVVQGTKEGVDGLKDGTEVVVKTTGKGTDATAVEVGKIGKDGLKATAGTIQSINKGTKTVVVKTADGTEKSFAYTGTALEDSGKAVGAGTTKGAKVTVYYTEETGKKIAHFFE
jgi:arginine repressor